MPKLKKHLFATEIICFSWEYFTKARKLITLVDCSSSVCPIVLVKSSRYTRVILHHLSAGENSKTKPAFTKYGAKHTKGSSIRILLPLMSEMP